MGYRAPSGKKRLEERGGLCSHLGSDPDNDCQFCHGAKLDGRGLYATGYPRRQAKPAAEQAWKRATRKAPPQQIIDAAAAYRDDPNREDGFTAHAATWLNQERWNDPPLPARGGQKQSAVASNMREYERLFGRRALGA